MNSHAQQTGLFSTAARKEDCVVGFIAKQSRVPGRDYSAQVDRLKQALEDLNDNSWRLSAGAMVEPNSNNSPMAFDVGFAHEADIVGTFEAPSITAALDGTTRLEKAGWSEIFDTEWLVGPREFASVSSSGDGIPRWGFLALWEWNDAWAAASQEERKAYDAECDVAFKGDISLNINIAGRHRLDWANSWHHLGVWEAPRFEIIDVAMRGHEAASDFMFTTSRHYVGRQRSLIELIRSHAGLSSD